jgi:hypothetical protein
MAKICAFILGILFLAVFVSALSNEDTEGEKRREEERREEKLSYYRNSSILNTRCINGYKYMEVLTYVNRGGSYQLLQLFEDDSNGIRLARCDTKE